MRLHLRHQAEAVVHSTAHPSATATWGSHPARKRKQGEGRNTTHATGLSRWDITDIVVGAHTLNEQAHPLHQGVEMLLVHKLCVIPTPRCAPPDSDLSQRITHKYKCNQLWRKQTSAPVLSQCTMMCLPLSSCSNVPSPKLIASSSSAIIWLSSRR